MSEPGHEIVLLMSEQARAAHDELADLLVDAVESGAAVNFVRPMTRAKALAWWNGALSSHARGERLLLVARRSGRVEGTVQVILAPQENQAFRADIAKMIVHRSARRRGLGMALLAAAESEARRAGRTLLTLDTQTDAAGEQLYRRAGWTKFGEVPGYATNPDGKARHAASFFFKQL